MQPPPPKKKNNSPVRCTNEWLPLGQCCCDLRWYPKVSFREKKEQWMRELWQQQKSEWEQDKRNPPGKEKRTNGDGAGLSHRVWRSRCLSRGCWRPVGRQIACRLWLNVRRFVRLGGIVTEFSCFCASHAQELHKRASQYVYRHRKKKEKKATAINHLKPTLSDWLWFTATFNSQNERKPGGAAGRGGGQGNPFTLHRLKEDLIIKDTYGRKMCLKSGRSNTELLFWTGTWRWCNMHIVRAIIKFYCTGI